MFLRIWPDDAKYIIRQPTSILEAKHDYFRCFVISYTIIYYHLLSLDSIYYWNILGQIYTEKSIGIIELTFIMVWALRRDL